MTVNFGPGSSIFNATHQGQLIRMDDQLSKYLLIYTRPGDENSYWVPIIRGTSLYTMCKIWRTSFIDTMSLQEFLDGLAI